MNWEAIGAIGEIIGAIGVIISLIYLSVQIRHNSRQVEEQSKALNATSLNAIEDTFTRFRESIIRDPSVASLYRKALDSFEQLTEDEKIQAGTIFEEWCWAWNNNYFRLQQETVDTDIIEKHLRNISFVLNHPGAQEWWTREKRWFTPEFVEITERILKEEGQSSQS